MGKKRKLNLLQRFFKRYKGKDIIVKPNKITLFYDEYLQGITEIPFEETMVSEDFTFADCLHSLFVSYPEIPKRVPPGRLGFLLNGRRPETFDILKDGDRVQFTVFNEQIKLTKDQIEVVCNQIEAEISNLIERYKVDINLEKIKEVIFNEKSFKDFHQVIDAFSEKIEDLDKANEVLNVLTKAWNYFPHKSLNGLCPMEKILESQQNKKSNPSSRN